MSSDNPTVEYRNILGFIGYRVGNDGSVWTRRKRGSNMGFYPDWRLVKPGVGKKGYHRVCLYQGPPRRYIRRSVHHLVLEAFVGPCPPGLECCHNNGNAADNRLCNLRWGTPSSNQQDRLAHGTDCRGEKNVRAKLTQEAVLFIRANAGQFTRRLLAKRFGVTRQLVTLVIKRKCWAWLLP